MDVRLTGAIAAKIDPGGMVADHLAGIEKFESGLWKIADNLRANSNLASNEYFMPIMGLISCAMPRTGSMRHKRQSRPTRRRVRCRIARWSKRISPAAAP